MLEGRELAGEEHTQVLAVPKTGLETAFARLADLVGGSGVLDYCQWHLWSLVNWMTIDVRKKG